MKRHLPYLLLAAALPLAALAVNMPPPSVPPASAPDSFFSALIDGTPTVNLRVRFEQVQQSSLTTADAITERLLLGYATAPFHGFQAYIEGENIEPIQKDYFDGTGTNGSHYATVADPEMTMIHQAWLSYSAFATKAIIGRQAIILDNARFVGDVGWRQNSQTFDALSLHNQSIKNLSLTYAYLERINRVFDDSGAQPDYHSNSHLFNAAYTGLPFGTLTGYAYLLDFKAQTGTSTAKTAALDNSTQTYGLSYAGAYPLTSEFKLTYRLEYAIQSDYGNSQVNYTASYYTGELGLAAKPASITAGYEVLGSDNNQGFRTPLATLHAFDGWADMFLVTPAAGLTDTYIKTTAKIPGPVVFTAFYHFFGTDTGPDDIGHELDFTATYKLTKQIGLLAGIGKFWSDQTGYANVQKVWLEADYKF